MNTKRWLIASAVAFVVFSVLEMILHGVFLSGIYEQTASVWRPEAEMKGLVWLMWVGYALFSLVFARIYAKGYEKDKGGLGQGLRYGLLIGLLVASVTSFGWYVVLPIPGRLAAAWFVGGLIESVIAGAAVGLVYKPS